MSILQVEDGTATEQTDEKANGAIYHSGAKSHIKRVARAMGVTSMKTAVGLVFGRLDEELDRKEVDQITVTEIKLSPRKPRRR